MKRFTWMFPRQIIAYSQERRRETIAWSLLALILLIIVIALTSVLKENQTASREIKKMNWFLASYDAYEGIQDELMVFGAEYFALPVPEDGDLIHTLAMRHVQSPYAIVTVRTLRLPTESILDGYTVPEGSPLDIFYVYFEREGYPITVDVHLLGENGQLVSARIQLEKTRFVLVRNIPEYVPIRLTAVSES